MSRPPFPAIKLSIVLVLVALALAGLGIAWSQGAARDARATLERQQAAHEAAQERLARSREQQRLIEDHLADYQGLVSSGFVGAEDRLAWIEAVQLASRATGLSGLEYRLSPRARAAPTLAQGLPLGQTSMTLSIPILVETDLPRFLEALRTRTRGIYRVQSCRLSRTGNEAFEAINQPRLKAECELVWYSVAPSPGGSAS
ncbi:MAG: hypothetical protein ACK4UX_10450 [Thiobacillus sp.]